MKTDISLTFKALTMSRWKDFEALFGDKGACGGCWCMYWRLAHKRFEQQKGTKNKRAMKLWIESGKVPGILAYDGRQAVGWCSIEPRERLVRFESSRIFKPVDDQPVWAINCLFIARDYRRQGVSEQLIRAAVDYAASKKARIVEGYPFEPKTKSQPDPFVWTGLASSYRGVGFVEVARRSPTRPVMRLIIGK